MIARISMIALLLHLVTPAVAQTTTEGAAEVRIAAVSDIERLTKRDDGRFDVVCRDGATEIITAEQLQFGDVCNGQPPPRPGIIAIFARPQGDFYVLCVNRTWEVASHLEIEDGRVCEGEGEVLTFVGYATWRQNGREQSDRQQDQAMAAACAAAHAGSRPATVDEIMGGIEQLPATNTSSEWLIGACPNCEGIPDSELKSGHRRRCVDPTDPWPKSGSEWNQNCYLSSRSALCVR